MYRIQIYISIIIFAFAIDSFPQAGLDDLGWLTGSWKRIAGTGFVFENWHKVSENTFEGVGLKVVDDDTTVLERLRLEQFGAEIFYVAKVDHNELPVAFKLVKKSENQWVFENLAHDFPQRITYTRESDKAINVRVEKDNEGKSEGFDVKFIKEKVN